MKRGGVRVVSFKNVSELKPFIKQQILESSKLKELVDDNFKFVENGIEHL